MCTNGRFLKTNVSLFGSVVLLAITNIYEQRAIINNDDNGHNNEKDNKNNIDYQDYDYNDYGSDNKNGF